MSSNSLISTAHDLSIPQAVLTENIRRWKQKNTGFRTGDLQELKLLNWIEELPRLLIHPSVFQFQIIKEGV